MGGGQHTALSDISNQGFPSPDYLCSIKTPKVNSWVGFVDNTDLCITADNNQATTVLHQMQDSLGMWTALLRATGRALVPKKCFQYFVRPVWQQQKGTWDYEDPSPRHHLKVPDDTGRLEEIPQLKISRLDAHLGSDSPKWQWWHRVPVPAGNFLAMAIFNSNHQSHSFSSRIWDPTNDTAQIGISVGDTPWNPKNLQNVTQQCHQVYTNKKIATSSSQEKCDGTYQLGEQWPLHWANGQAKWSTKGETKTWDDGLTSNSLDAMARKLLWSLHMRLCTRIRHYFKHCHCTTKLHTSTTGQHISQPKQFIHDLIQKIQAWHTTGKEVILGMDANEHVDHPQSDIMHLFNKTDLIGLHTHCYPATQKPVTHQHGSHPIDLIAGTPRCASAIRHTWMLTFGMPPLIKGYHCLLGIDFDTDLLFSNSPTNPMPTTPWGVNSKHKLHVTNSVRSQLSNAINIISTNASRPLKQNNTYPPKIWTNWNSSTLRLPKSWYQQITGAAHSVAPLGPQLSKQHTPSPVLVTETNGIPHTKRL